MMFDVLQVLKTLNNWFNNFLDKGDPRLKDWPLMRNPFASWVMIAAYVYFVKVAGPKWMQKKEPYDLRYTMAFYNFAMVFANLYVFLALGWYGYFDGYTICQAVDYSNSYKAVKMAEAGWIFYILKFVEFADTVFFVLRKKNNQISALHVIHHSLVPFSLWFGVKFAPGGYNAFFPFLNTFVHVLMYTYYALAALGPKYQKYLFWKKYMTYIQMTQFVAVMLFALFLTTSGCNVSSAFIFMNGIHALLFLVLFYNFFRTSYGKRKIDSPSSSPQSNGEIFQTVGKKKATYVLESKLSAKLNGSVKNGKFLQRDSEIKKLLSNSFTRPEEQSKHVHVLETSNYIRKRHLRN